MHFSFSVMSSITLIKTGVFRLTISCNTIHFDDIMPLEIAISNRQTSTRHVQSAIITCTRRQLPVQATAKIFVYYDVLKA